MTETMRFAAYSYDPSFVSGFIPFLAPDTKAALTQIELHFDARLPNYAGGKDASLLRYTLELERDNSIGLLPSRVGYEALHCFPKGRPRRIFERRGGKEIHIAREANVRSRDDRLAAIPQNASAISALARMGVGLFPQIAQDFANVQTNIAGVDPWRPDSETITRHYREDPRLLEQVSDKLRRFDLGIGKMVPQMLPDGTWLLTFAHHGLDTAVVLDSESAGTRHLVHVFPQLNYALHNGNMVIMDALDRDFHTELSVEIIDWFRREDSNPHNAQLICSLHNLSILDDLEKEEVFIVEKGLNGATDIYGALEIAGLRRGGNLQKQYRSGVMGGLPTFG